MLDVLVAGQTAKNLLIPVAVVAGVGTASYIGYKAAKAAFGWAEDIPEMVTELLNKDVGVGESPVPIIEALLGKKEYTDKSGQTFFNPFAGIPIAGPLFGAGINIGIATNPKFWRSNTNPADTGDAPSPKDREYTSTRT